MNPAGEILRQQTPEVLAAAKRLSRAPKIAWRTIGILIYCIASFVVVDTLAVLGYLPLWAGMLINGVTAYYLFSVVHDAIHGAVSSNARINDWVGRIALLSFLPQVTLELFRWGHIRHHRLASGALDPDRWMHVGPWWQLPLRWVTVDFYYLYYVLKHGDTKAHRYLRQSMVTVAGTVLAASTIIAAGYGWELLFLWFIPARITKLLVGFSFFWLPHVPHDVSQEENYTRATTVRLGNEWLMSPLLQWQNFHLMHHMFPSAPFYNNARLWHLLEPSLRRYDLAIQSGWRIHPEIHVAEKDSALVAHQ